MRILRLLLVFVLLGLAGAGWALYELKTPYQGFESQVFVDIPRGTSTRRMAEMLARAGAVRHAWVFEAARFLRPSGKLQAGEYRFDHAALPEEVVSRIVRGDVFYYPLTVPEGKNIFEIGELVAASGLMESAEFVKAARDPAPIRDLDPQAPSLEGYLFPSTYSLSRHTTPEQLCRIMTDEFRSVWAGLHTTADVHRTVTLASLVEKEGKLPADRPLIAAVFENRLKLGMKLDCDPTTIYAALLDGSYRGAIYKSDLASDSAYNTYQHAGLPPGPIANPGVAAIQAVLHPADADYLFFVLKPDGSGGHTFSRTLEEQRAAIKKYRHALPR